MAEQVTFDAAVEPPKTVFRIAYLSFDWFNAHITIGLREWITDSPAAFGPMELPPIHYTGDLARSFMITLNKANLSTQSLHQRVITKLLADGKIPAGTSSGAPD
jgi:hypothetical protein